MGLLDGIDTADQVELLRRRKLATDPQMQALLAGREHRAYARETVQHDPLMALSLLVATPAYQLAKLGGMTKSRSAPSLSQMGQGLLGIGEGLYNRYGK
jgi:hypothetical protein